ncbi:MAG: replicative DNA helicase [Deltaproteobacteria bacterium]|nr:replicative DNA helicase [Deltaproteobacteria bacterium]
MNKIPPQNLEAEISVLGAVLLENEALNEVADLLRSGDFYKNSHQTIFEALLQLSEAHEPADLITLTNILRKNNKLEAVGGTAYLASLVNSVPSASNIKSYAKIIREKSILRKLVSVANDISNRGYDDNADVEEFLDFAESSLFEVTDANLQSGILHIKDLMKSSFKKIEELHERKSQITGVPTGFTDIDKLTSGLQSGDLVVIAGRPSMGKTSFALNIVQYASRAMNQPVVFFSLEMSKEQVVTRLLTSLSRVDASRLRVGNLTDSDWPKLTKAAGYLSEAPIYIDDTPGISVLEMKAKCRRLKARSGLALIVIDYLQLMRSRGFSESREREISEISRSLKALAKELQLPIIALSQLNRAVEARQDKRPMMSDLRESGSIEQDSDIIAFIYRDEVYKPESEYKGTAEIIIAKQRNGPTGFARLAFLNQYTSFENLSHGSY